MSIFDCERIAQDREPSDSMRFLITPAPFTKPVLCKWLDAYMGLFQVEGKTGFIMSRELNETLPDHDCEILDVS